jgi:hypothetical protein
VERLTIALLQREGSIAFDLLVQQVSDELFQQEIDEGAWLLDIGLFGSTIFVRDVANEIKAGNGNLWDIERTLKTALGS